VVTADPCTTTPSATESYSYDDTGERVGMKRTGGPNFGDYYYARNLHTDVSLLETDGGAAKAAYVYKPYGAQDSLSFGDLESPDTLNSFRFNDKRLDSGSVTLDMGARRYSSDVGRFVQPDFFTDAVADRGVILDPSLQNRYVFGSANPTNSIEIDGHCYNVHNSINPAQLNAYHVRGERKWLCRLIVGLASRRCEQTNRWVDDPDSCYLWAELKICRGNARTTLCKRLWRKEALVPGGGLADLFGLACKATYFLAKKGKILRTAVGDIVTALACPPEAR
jgi:RHS repeat-associated protein